MSMEFQVERLVPQYLLRDKNGRALAKAIERAFQLVADAAAAGLGIIQDPEKMPEWRLDEMAWELGCLYDYSGTLEKKRYWIANASYLYAIYGTPQGIINFLEGAFPSAEVEEFYGDPYHFRIVVSGESYDAEKIAWAQKVVAVVKNVRSVLDTIAVDNSTEITVSAGADAFGARVPRTAEYTFTGAEGGL